MTSTSTPPPTTAPRWAGVTSAHLSGAMVELSHSGSIDLPIADHDLAASVVHVEELERLGLLTSEEAAVASGALQEIRRELGDGLFAWQPQYEDIHMNVEAALAARVGETIAGQLQAGRSRNEEVVTDERRWLLAAAARLDAAAAALQHTLLDRAEEELREGTVLPAYTHGQPAQPVLLAHHLLAWVEMLERDRERLRAAAARADRSPAGSGAVAGSGLSLDRSRIADALGFGGITANSIDAVADRDYAAELATAAAIAMGHLSRLAGELAVWSSPAVGFVRLGDGYVSGSSMLPNKRNPDSCELVRARAARVEADAALILEIPRGLPLAYHRDLQETRAPMLDAAASLELCLTVMTGVVATLTFMRERMGAAADEGSITATALAERLVAAGVPFREAHQRVGALVRRAQDGGGRLEGLPRSELAATLPELVHLDTILPSLADALAGAALPGGTAPARVAEGLAAARARHEAAEAQRDAP